MRKKIVKYRKYTVEHTCGHRQTYRTQKWISQRQAQRKIEYLRQFECPVCLSNT